MNKIPPPAPCPWLTAPKLTWLPRGIGGGGGTGGVALVLASFPHKTKGEKSRTFSSSVGARLTQESLLSQAAAAAPIFLGDLCDTHSAFTFGSGRPFEKRRGKKTESKDRSKFSWPLSGRRRRRAGQLLIHSPVVRRRLSSWQERSLRLCSVIRPEEEGGLCVLLLVFEATQQPWQVGQFGIFAR